MRHRTAETHAAESAVVVSMVAGLREAHSTVASPQEADSTEVAGSEATAAKS